MIRREFKYGKYKQLGKDVSPREIGNLVKNMEKEIRRYIKIKKLKWTNIR